MADICSLRADVERLAFSVIWVCATSFFHHHLKNMGVCIFVFVHLFGYKQYICLLFCGDFLTYINEHINYKLSTACFFFCLSFCTCQLNTFTVITVTSWLKFQRCFTLAIGKWYCGSITIPAPTLMSSINAISYYCQ